MGRGTWLVGFALALSALACEGIGGEAKKDGADTKGADAEGAKGSKGDKGAAVGAACKKDGDCGTGLLCEEQTCVPEAVAKKARNAASPKAEEAKGAAATATAPAAAAATTCGPEKEVPVIPDSRSNPPSLDEWGNACRINTQGAGSEAASCTLKVLREWLQVTCNGEIVRYEDMDGFGAEGLDYFKLVNAGVASFVVRLKKQPVVKVRICRANDRASLFVSWPPGKDRPSIVALGRGAKCE